MFDTCAGYAAFAFTEAKYLVEKAADGCAHIREDIDSYIDSHLDERVAFVAKNTIGIPHNPCSFVSPKSNSFRHSDNLLRDYFFN